MELIPGDRIHIYTQDGKCWIKIDGSEDGLILACDKDRPEMGINLHISIDYFKQGLP